MNEVPTGMLTRARFVGVLRRIPPLYYLARTFVHAYQAAVGRVQLKRRVRAEREAGNAVRVVLGAGTVYEEGWIPTNVQYLDLLNDAHWQHAFASHPVDALLAEHVWEHLTLEEGRRAAARCYQYLKPGGCLRVAVPDGQNPDPEYLEFVRPGGSGPGADDHKMLYTLQSLRQLLESVGFAVEPLEYYDTDGRFHAAEWDRSSGRIHRQQGWTEMLPGGRVVPYTSLIVDARKGSPDLLNSL